MPPGDFHLREARRRTASNCGRMIEMATDFDQSMRQATPLETALKDSIGAFVFVFVYSCGYNLFLLTPSIYLLQIYDRVLSSRSIDTLVMLTLIVGTAVIVGSLLDAVRRAALSRIASWLDRRLRPQVLASAFGYATRVEPAVAADTYRHLSTIRQFLESPASALLFDIPWAPVFLGLLFMVHPVLGGIGTMSAIILLFFGLCNDWLTRRPSAIAAYAFSHSFSMLASALNHVELVRAMGMQEGALRLVDGEAEIVRRANDTAAHRAHIVQAFSKATRALTQIVMMGTACWLVLRDDSNPGIIFVASLLIGRGLAPIEGAIGVWRGVAQTRNACRQLNRMFVAVDATPKSPAVLVPKPTGRLVLENVGLLSAGARQRVVAGVSLSLEGGDCLAILGPSGSGKSALGRIIAGVARPDEGCVLLDGYAIAELRNSNAARRIGYLPQDIELFGGAIRNVIGRFDGGDTRSIVDAASMVGLHETIMRLPRGYETDVGEGGRLFLRAQRQQLGLARAIYGNPRLVVLDDPNSSLDYHGECLLFRLVQNLRARGVTVVVITHRMGILSATNRIAILQHGMLSAFGESEYIYETRLRPRARQTGIA